MGNYPDDTIIWGFTFVDELKDLNMNDIHEVLMDREAKLEDVIFSAWKSFADDCIWVVASDKYLEDIEVRDVVDFLIENDLENNFLFSING